MSVSLTYFTTHPVPASVAAHVRHEADECAARHDWWCEPFVFYGDPARPGHLVGDTKLFLVAYATAAGDFVHVDADDDTAMAWRDAVYIVDRLRLWSSRFGMCWQLEIEGEPIGRVDDGQPDDDLAAHLDDLLDGRPSTDAYFAQILARHADRNRRSSPAGDPVAVAHGPAKRSWWRFW